MYKKINWVSSDIICLAALFLLTNIIYSITLARTVYFGDSGELITASYNLGIAHPPGYPLYLLLGKLFQLLLPVDNIAIKMNFMSAFFASLSAMTIFLISRSLNHNWKVAFAVSITAAFSYTFWSQAIITEVYTLSIFFFCLLVFLFTLWIKTQHHLALPLMAVIAGFSMTHHILIAAYFPVFFAFMLMNKTEIVKNKLQLIKLCCLFSLPLLVYIYLPIRSQSNPLNDWGNPETLSSLYQHITASQFSGLFLKHGMEGVFYQFTRFIDLLLLQFPLPILLLSVAGMIIGWKQEAKITLFLSALILVNIGYSVSYVISDIDAYYTNTFILLALFSTFSLQLLLSKSKTIIPKYGYKLAVITIAILAVLPLSYNFTKANLSNNKLAYNLGINLLNSIEEDSILFVDGEDELFILAYLTIVENIRPDITIYDLRQNIFFIPKVIDKGRDNSSIKDLYQLTKKLLNSNKSVYFTNTVFNDLHHQAHGLVYKVTNKKVTTKPDTSMSLAIWDSYNLSDIKNVYYDIPSKKHVGYYLYKEGLLSSQQRDISKAKKNMQEALKVSGHQIDILKLVANYHFERNNLATAQNIAEKGIKKHPLNSDLHHLLAVIFHQKNNNSEALSHYSRAIELKQNNLQALVNRSILLEKSGDMEKIAKEKNNHYKQAINDLQMCLTIEPNNNYCTNRINTINTKFVNLQFQE